MSAFANILIGGVFHAAVLFLVAAGLSAGFRGAEIWNFAWGPFFALGLCSRRELSVAADVRAGADVSGRLSLLLGPQSAHARQRLSDLWRGAGGRFQRAGLQPAGHRGSNSGGNR